MRTEERWKAVIQEKIIQRKFPPRIAEDLIRLQLPAIEEYHSQYIYSIEKETGKTIRACLLMLGHEKRAYIEANPISTCFVSVTDFINELKSCFDTPGKSEMNVLEKYQRMDVLVLDDIGTCPVSDWMYHILYSLINYRYEWIKTTIITSNFNLRELHEKLGDDRVTSRIERSGEITEKLKYDRI